ncbi:MAG: hypothetical protein ACOYW3_11535 [Bacteroidota bacterium]
MNADDEKPPVFQQWKSWYWLVMLALAIQVIIYWTITNRFA